MAPPPVLSDNGRHEIVSGDADHWMSDTAATITDGDDSAAEQEKHCDDTRTDTPGVSDRPSTLG
jgi:hypothetical protein